MTSTRKNYIMQCGYQVLTLIMPLITTPYVTRVLGASGMGIYSYTYSIAYYFVLCITLGINNYGNREVAKARTDPEKLNIVTSEILGVHVSVGLLVCLIYVIYVTYFVGAEYEIYAWIQGIYLLGAILDINWIYFGLEKFKLTIVRNTFIKFLTVIFIFLFVKTSNDLWKYVMIMALGTVISNSIVWLFLSKYVKFVKFGFNNSLRHMKPMIILFLPTIAVSVYRTMDKIMLGAMTNTTNVGYFESTERIITITLSFIASLGTVMMPRMAYLFAQKKDEKIKKTILNSMRFVMFVAFAITFGLISIAEEFVPVFFGKDFNVISVSGYLKLLAVTIPFIAYANVIRTQFLIPNNKEKTYLTAVSCGAIVNFSINLFLIPRYGVWGAVYGTIAAECLVSIIQAIAVRNDLPVLEYIKESIPFMIFGLLMYIVVRIIANIGSANIFTLILEIIFGAVTYVTLSIIYSLKTGKSLKLEN